MIQVLLVDDHHLVREGLRQILGSTADIVVTGEADNGQSALELIRAESFDVVVLDINLPDQNGLHWLKLIKHDYPKVPVLMLTMFGEREYAVRCIRAGAAGYLTKHHAGNELLAAIRYIATGRKYVTPTVGAELAAALDNNVTHLPALESISDREMEVLLLLSAGHSIGKIADYMKISVKTVSTYRTRLLQKLNLTSTADLVRYAISEGITS
jgi:two-component system, NarL family, invasion response regulator UvrY